MGSRTLTRTLTLAIAAAVATMPACGTDEASTGADADIVVETIGDTTVVRTLSGSVWGAEATLVPELSIGEMDGPAEYLFGRVGSIAVDDDRRVFVLDGQAQHVRVFDSTGTYVETLGRRGEGPGELSSASSVGLLADGRVLVHEAIDMRIQVYGPGPRDREQWKYSANTVLISGPPVDVDRHGRTFVVAAHTTPSGRLVQPLIVMGTDGSPQDTLLPPGSDFEPPSLELLVHMGSVTTQKFLSPVPLTARHHWALHPNGHFVTGVSSDYRIDLGLDNGVLRIERAYEPVPISDAERSHHREDLERGMRVSQPDWSWNGPPIPETKPPFRDLATGRDGRIWVTLSTESHSVENERHDPQNPNSQPVLWRSPLRYDIFEPDGTYLGTVVPPEGFSRTPRPVFHGEHVWGVARDELGVERVVRYRIVVGG